MAITDLDEAAALKIPIGDAARADASSVVDGHRVPSYNQTAGATEWLTGQVLRGSVEVVQSGHGFGTPPNPPRGAAYVADAGLGSPGWVLVTNDLADVEPTALVTTVAGNALTVSRSGTFVPGVNLGYGPLWLQGDGTVSTTKPGGLDEKITQVGTAEGAVGYHVNILRSEGANP